MTVKEVEKLDALQTEVRDLKKLVVAKLRDVAPFVVPITTLSPGLFDLIRDIPAVIQSTGDDFTATFFDAGISATGDTEEDAIFNLKDILVAKFDLLDKTPEKQLGKGPRRQIVALRTLIRRSQHG